MPLKTQDDIVKQDKEFQPKEMVRKVVLPGIAQLHLRPTAEIAEVLANVLRMDRGITEIKWIVGKHIELTIDTTL